MIELMGNMASPHGYGETGNDGMNLVSEQGKGESVWLGCVIRAIEEFSDYAEQHVKTQVKEFTEA
jgi:cellobiose phosphorylase